MTVRGLPQFRRRAARPRRRAPARRRVHRVVELLLPRLGAAPVDRHAVEGLQAPHLPRAGADPRSGGADHGRADRRPRPEPEARGAQPHPRARRNNKAIVFSTHILEEVDAACTRAIIIDRGRIVANGTPEELRAMSELAGAVTLQARGASAERLVRRSAGSRRLNGAFRIYPTDKSQGGAARAGSGRAGQPARLEGRGHVQRARRARRGVPPHHAARHGEEKVVT